MILIQKGRGVATFSPLSQSVGVGGFEWTYEVEEDGSLLVLSPDRRTRRKFSWYEYRPKIEAVEDGSAELLVPPVAVRAFVECKFVRKSTWVPRWEVTHAALTLAGQAFVYLVPRSAAGKLAMASGASAP